MADFLDPLRSQELEVTHAAAESLREKVKGVIATWVQAQDAEMLALVKEAIDAEGWARQYPTLYKRRPNGVLVRVG